MHAMLLMAVRLLAPALGVVFGLLGLSTLEKNLLGWFLLIVGILYAAGAIILAYVLRRNAWDMGASGPLGTGAPSLGWVSLSLAAACLISPLEFIYVRRQALPFGALEITGVCLGALGAVLFIWGRWYQPKSFDAAPAEMGMPFPLLRGPYAIVRHPVYAAYLLLCAGLAVGYGSLAGLSALVLLLFPVLLLRINLEERSLSARFGREYLEYSRRTKRLVPGLW